MCYYMETRGLGAGSYPEPPDLPEEAEPECEECGWSRDLGEMDGMTLCRYCRNKRHLQNEQDRFQEFINRNLKQQEDFYLTWWFLQLEKDKQAEIAKRAWSREYGRPLSNSKKAEAGQIVRDYITEMQDDFGEYIEGDT